MRIVELTSVIVRTLRCEGCKRDMALDEVCYWEGEAGNYYCPDCVDLTTLTLKGDATAKAPKPDERVAWYTHASGPAYPTTLDDWNGGFGGMSLRTRVAIDLGVPDSEVPFVNDMIRKSRRLDAAMTVLGGQREGRFPEDMREPTNVGRVVGACFKLADAMLAERGKGGDDASE